MDPYLPVQDLDSLSDRIDTLNLYFDSMPTSSYDSAVLQVLESSREDSVSRKMPYWKSIMDNMSTQEYDQGVLAILMTSPEPARRTIPWWDSIASNMSQG